MPTPRCSKGAACLHDLARDRDNGDDFECEESDPSGRYVRYKEVLGRGAFKTVYRAFDEIDGIEVAWNQIKLQNVVRSSEDLERLLSEVHLLKTLKHRNIIKFYHSWIDMDAQHINFITEVFTSGTLRQYRRRHKHMDIRAVKNWSRQILRGLLYLHSHDPPIIHRDLKCDNIFINGNQGEVKIGDLGLAAILHQAHSAHSVIGTPEFMAPEFYEEEYTELVDIYSFGMCLLEMATFEYPYSECTNAAQIYKKVTSGEKPAALKKVKDPYLRQFVEKCLASASRRLSARELLMDPFLQYNNDQDLHEPCLAFTKSMVNVGDMDVIETLMGKRNHSAPLLVRENDLATQHSRSLNMPTVADYKEKKSRSMDFRVKGKKRENDTVHLRIRIADSEGEVRVIHFPFDVESDTAMCVASEMVAELELADQDVTTIAEMIDAAVLAMVPEWKPGVAIDEGVEGKELDDEPVPSNEFQNSQWSPDHLSTVSLESRSTDHSHHPQTDNMMHGRFEEVMYHSHTPECRIHPDEEQGVIPMELGLREWRQGDELNLSGSTSSFDFKDSVLPEQGQGVLGSVYNRAIKSIRLTRCNGKRWIADDLCALIMDRKRQIDCCVRELYHQTARHMSYSRKAVSKDDSNELVKHELRTLAHQYAQELNELQCKHETAFLAWRKRWQEKGDVLYFEVQQDE